MFADFCVDAEAEAADVERSIRENVPLSEDDNRDLLAAHIRVGKVGPFISGLREVIGRIDKELWLAVVQMLLCPWSECIARRCARRS